MSNKKKAPKGMYTAGEAISVIGVPSTTFYDLVDRKTIKRIIPNGRREGFYVKSEVDRYARSQKALTAPYENENLDFGLALAEDLPQVFDLVSSVSGGPEHAVAQEVLKAWIRKNPRSIHVLRRDNEVLGYVSGFILPMETLEKRLDGTLLNAEIPIDDILPLDTPGPVPFYIAEMAVKPLPRSLNRPDAQLGAILIMHTANFILHDLKSQGVIVSELYAVGSSDFGINMCKKLGMSPIAGLAKGARADRMPCKINVNEISESLLFNRLANRLKAA